MGLRRWAACAGRASPPTIMYTAQPTFPFGAHLAVVEVDTETGKVTLVRHVSVDDAGRVLNPLIAEGQRHGGIAQGVAQALVEEVIYDPDGNLFDLLARRLRHHHRRPSRPASS